MSWAWLTSPPVLLVGFIAAMIGIPASVVMDVQLLRPLVRKITRPRHQLPAFKPAVGVSGLDAIIYDRRSWEWVSEHLESTGRFPS